MPRRPRWSKATVGVGVAAAVLATWLLATGPKCEPGGDWPRNWPQALALKDAWLRESGCRRSGVQCSYHIGTSTTGGITVMVQATAVDDAGRCIFALDNQPVRFHLSSGARSVSSPH